jgi:hypothetical protein
MIIFYDPLMTFIWRRKRMTVNTQHDQYILSVSGNPSLQKHHTSLPLLQENETITFDLHSRTLILTRGGAVAATQVAKLSPIDAHLLLPLLYFYPHHVSDSTLALGYTSDLLTYSSYVKGEIHLRKPDVSYPIADGVDRLKKKVAPLGITIVRVRTTGYVLERRADLFPKDGLQASTLYRYADERLKKRN